MNRVKNAARVLQFLVGMLWGLVRMLWLLVSGGPVYVMLLLVIAGVGVALIPDAWPPLSLGLPATSRTEVGAALLGGAVIGLAILLAEQALEKRQDREGLRLQLGLGRKFQGIDLSGRDLSFFYLRRKVFAEAKLTGANLNEANLNGADLTGADLNEANLTYARLRGADLPGASLTGASLTGADLTGADLTGASLTGAYLTGADLLEANLRGASLRGATNLDTAVLAHARYDQETKWPEDYTPDGVVCTPGSECFDPKAEHWHHV